MRQNEFELGRPNIVTTLLWAFGIFIIGYAVYSLIFWEDSSTTMDLHDSLLIVVAFSSGINAIATRVLIDMHTKQYNTRSKIQEQMHTQVPRIRLGNN